MSDGGGFDRQEVAGSGILSRPAGRLALLVTFAAIICARIPDAVLHGRFWAEEGPVFYKQALAMPWWQAVTTSYGGYLNVVANTAPVLAHALLPLEYVPWFTTAVGLFFQCCPAILLVCSRDDWLRPRLALFAALLLIAMPSLVEEVWLQTLHSQFHLALCGALILALDIPRRRLAWFNLAVLLLAPLCGPPSWLLLPLFALRSLLDRSWRRSAQTCALGFGVGLQLAFFYNHGVTRSLDVEPVVLLCVVYIKQIVVPLLGRDIAAIASNALQGKLATGHVPLRAITMSLVYFTALIAAALRRSHPAATWLMLALIPLGFIGYLGAIDAGPRMLIIGNDGRYSFLPEVLSSLLILVVATGRRTPDAWVARALVVWLLAAGAVDIRTPWPFIKTGPDWLTEVARWRHDHSYPIKIWPPGWTLSLKSD